MFMKIFYKKSNTNGVIKTHRLKDMRWKCVLLKDFNEPLHTYKLQN